MLSAHHLRARFAAAMAAMYGEEVGLYNDLVRITEASNAAYLDEERKRQSELLSAEEHVNSARIFVERHGAVRLASPQELKQLVEVYRVMGMHPVNFYNLTAVGNAAPVIAIAARPLELYGDETVNPFRMFTSVLDVSALACDASLKAEIREVIDKRAIFPASLESEVRTADVHASELGTYIRRFDEHGGLTEADAEAFVALATRIFAMSDTLAIPVELYERIRAVHEVAADILGFPNPHINHLTPRALNIQDAYDRMAEEGRKHHFRMLAKVQGPPTAMQPNVLLNQTSYVAKPTWVFADAKSQKCCSAAILQTMQAAIEAKGIMLDYSGELDLAKLGLALDNAGYHLQALFGEVKRHFQLQDVADALGVDLKLPAIAVQAHTARFGEIEARYIALTPKGRALYDEALAASVKAYEGAAQKDNAGWQRVAERVFKQTPLWPREDGNYTHLIEQELAYFRYELADESAFDASCREALASITSDSYLPQAMQLLVKAGAVHQLPMIYEDFLPASAAGIFLGNQTEQQEAQDSSRMAAQLATVQDPKLQQFLDEDVPIYVAYNLYAAEEARTVLAVVDALAPELTDTKAVLEQRIAAEHTLLQLG